MTDKSKKEQIAVRLPPAGLVMLDMLIGTIYGTNRGEVARSLILKALEDLAAQNRVEWVVVKESGDHNKPPSL
jgi:hypothetical protein